MAEAIYIALNALLLLALVASLVMWVQSFRRRIGLSATELIESLLPARPRQRPFWNVGDTLVMFGIMVIVGQALLVWMLSHGWIERVPVIEPSVETNVVETDVPSEGAPSEEVPSEEVPSEEISTGPLAADKDAAETASAGKTRHATPESMTASVVANSVAGVLSVVVVLLWLRLFDRDARRKVGLRLEPGDVWLGLKSSVMILPPVLLISAAAAYFIPYEHPVLESLAVLSTPTVLVSTFIGTALVTPVFEELLLRGLLQGGLQGMVDRDAGEDEYGWVPRSFWPVVASSLIFAIMHVGQGAAPIPLFFLSLGLGYLYRQTGCLTAPIVVHMVLNTLTLVAEVAKLQSTSL